MGAQQSRMISPAEMARRERMRQRWKERESRARGVRRRPHNERQRSVESFRGRAEEREERSRRGSRSNSRNTVDGERNPGAAPVPVQEIPSWWTIRLGAEIPNFNCKTTQGNFKLHDFCTGDKEASWTIMFSHPKDFTPICTTELGLAHLMLPKFRELGVKMIGVSCDPVESHREWMKDICAYSRIKGGTIDYPIIEDTSRDIVTLLGMLDPKEKDSADIPLPARAVIVLDEKCKVRLSLLYPATTGRDFDEILRAVKSLKLTTNNGLGTPANWKPGDRCIVTPAVKTEDAIKRFKNFETKKLPSGKPYLRLVDQPEDPNFSGLKEQKKVRVFHKSTSDTSAMKDAEQRASDRKNMRRVSTATTMASECQESLDGDSTPSEKEYKNGSSEYIGSRASQASYGGSSLKSWKRPQEAMPVF